ncbi:MAG: efflux RND transporter permease subunit [Sphingomonadales bacterium]
MRFTDIFIQRPVLASVVSLLILLLGLQAASELPIREFPEFETTQIVVSTDYPGASPDVIRSFITTPLQQSVASAEGIDTISSYSRQSVSTISLTLRTGADADRAYNDVLSRVNAVRADLPREAFDPVVERLSAEGTGLAYIDYASATLTPSQITDFLVRVAQPALQAVEGVAQARILGAQTFAMRIWLNPGKMASLEVTASDVIDALERNNFTSAAGEIKGGFVTATVDAKTNAATVQDFQNLVVAVRDGTLIRLNQVADIKLGPQSADNSSFAGGNRAIFVEITAQPSGNPLEVVPAVRQRLQELEPLLPPGLIQDMNYDASTYIKAAIIEVSKTVIEAAIIVVIVVYLFLGNVRATLVPVITIPLSLIGVLFLVQLLGYSINLLTLLALVLAIGLVVDDAIVVLENISRHIEKGLSPLEAAFKGAREIALPVIAMTVTLAAAYAPIGFTTGLTGQLFQEFAFTLASAVIISGGVALTLSPMMCARILKSQEDKEDKFALWLEHKFTQLKFWYRARLVSALKAQKLGLFTGFLVLGMCAFLYQTAQKELAPEEDQGLMYLATTAPDWTNIDYINSYVSTYHDVFQRLPEYETAFLINGRDGPSSGFGGILLKPWEERDRGPKAILEDLAADFSNFAGVEVAGFSAPPLPTPGDGFPFQFVLKSLGGYEELYEAAEELQSKIDMSGKFIFTDLSLNFDKPEIEVTVDREKANQLGVSMRDIGNTLSTLLGGNYVNLFDLDGRSYRVIPQVPRAFRFDESLIGGYYVRATSGDLVPLSTFVQVERVVKPNAQTTFQQLNSATISGVPYPGVSMGDALSFVQATAAEILPPAITTDTSGQTRQYVQEGNQLAIIFVFALVVIYLVLAAQFESFRDPFIILVTVPMAAVGALIPINVFLSVNIYTQIGLITLIGLISKHGILMVDFANQLQREEGLSPHDAMVKSAGIRLRPILMTTAAIVFGVMPLLLADGAGAASRFHIGATIVGGMTIGTLFTLFILPIVYTLMASKPKPLKSAEMALAEPAE